MTCRREAHRLALRIAKSRLRGLPLMALASLIEWTDATWNPVTGYDKVIPGCAHCYAERMVTRLQAMGQADYARGIELTLQPAMLELPLRWRKSRRNFVNSMSDLFHDEVLLDYVRRVFDVMQSASWHEFQVLTKRAERLAQLAPSLPWPKNAWRASASRATASSRALTRCGRCSRRCDSSRSSHCSGRCRRSIGAASTGRSSGASRGLARGRSTRRGCVTCASSAPRRASPCSSSNALASESKRRDASWTEGRGANYRPRASSKMAATNACRRCVESLLIPPRTSVVAGWHRQPLAAPTSPNLPAPRPPQCWRGSSPPPDRSLRPGLAASLPFEGCDRGSGSLRLRHVVGSRASWMQPSTTTGSATI